MNVNVLVQVFLILICLSCNKVNRDIVVYQDQAEYPVLKFKDYNNVLQLNISCKDTLNDILLTEVFISAAGTTSLSDLESVALYYTGNRISLVNEKSLLFAKVDKPGAVVRLKGSLKIRGNQNHFQLSYKLKENADITHKAGASCMKVVTDRGTAVVNKLTDQKHLRIGVAVRKHDDDNVDTYRIPGLAATNKGSLLAVYDVRRDSKRDLQGNIDIGISRSTDGGNSWEPMVVALDMVEWGGLPQKFNGVSDASILADRKTGNIFVAGLWMYGVLDDNGKWIENLTDTSKAWNHQWRNRGSQPGFDVKQSSQFLITRSTDDGRTWEAPVNLTTMCKKSEWWLWAPAPGNGITLDDGTLVFPTQGRDKEGVPFSNVTYSNDGGTTWKTSNPAYTNTTECAVVQLSNGAIMLNMRNNRNKNNEGPDNGRAVAVTTDMGKTWTEHPTSHSALIEPVCMGSLYRHMFNDNGQQKSILFFSNPSTKKGRNHITIKASLDDGATWPEKYWLLLDEGNGNGYSCLTSVDNDNIGILYESSQADLVFEKLSLSDILK
jgi:sialidase-1